VGGIALTGLLAVLLSPVAWIHHLVWLPLVIGVVVDDARSRRRVAWGAATTAFFIVRVPWIGRHMLHTAWPQPLARVVEDGFGLAAVWLLLALPRRGDVTPTGLVDAAGSGHDEACNPAEVEPERVSATPPGAHVRNHHPSRGGP
jgi:alpha-1,2-mannosyltransferase